jgi:hypothetical protein
MLQAIMTANNLSYTAVMDIIRLFNTVFQGDKLPESEYLFKKVCSVKIDCKKLYFCDDCLSETFENLPKGGICPKCNKKSMDYFVSTPIKNSLRTIMMRNLKSVTEYKSDLESMDTEIISDINNSKWYKDLNLGNDIITLNINTDGVAPYNASKKSSLWPILASINDLPLSIRFQKRNILSAAFWLSKNPPEMKLLMQPFVTEMIDLFNNGIQIGAKKYKVVVGGCCLDSPARCKVLCMKQFNGFYGCTYCQHPTVDRHYPLLDVQNRSIEMHMEHINQLQNLPETQRQNSVMGVKGRTILLDLPNFNPMLQCPVDFMHCVLLGVVKHMLNLHFSSKYKDQPFYVKNSEKQIVDDRFRRLKMCSEVTRKTETVTDKFNTWKANELYNFFFLASRYCLSAPVLSPPYYQNFLVLLETIEWLCSEKILRSNLQTYRENLKNFVQQFQLLYGVDHIYMDTIYICCYT